MPDRRLKTGVLGLDRRGQVLLKACSQLECIDIVAVADRDTQAAEKAGAEYGCAFYDDYRQLILQNELDSLLLAAGLYSCDEYLRMAMKKKFNVLKLPPAGRGFEEAAEFVRLSEEKGVKFAVGNRYRFSGGLAVLSDFLEESPIEQVYLIVGSFIAGTENKEQWHDDPKLSGGGVLLRNSYEVIDFIVSAFSMPQRVYSLNMNRASDRQQRLYLTEDTAVLTMKFSDTFAGNLTASRAFGLQEALLKIYGKDKILTVSEKYFAVSDGGGEVMDEQKFDFDELGATRKMVESFAQSILEPDKYVLLGSAREHLSTMAVIESAYLSARTGMPEEPGRIFEMTAVR